MTNFEAYMALFGIKMTNGEAQAVFATREQAEGFIEVFKSYNAEAGPMNPMVTLEVEETQAPITVKDAFDAVRIMDGEGDRLRPEHKEALAALFEDSADPALD